MEDVNIEALAEGLARLQDRFAVEDQRKAEEEALAAIRKEQEAIQGKFGHLYGNDENIGQLIFDSLKARGASAESATEEAIMEMVITPLADVLKKMTAAIASTIGNITTAVEEQAQEIINGPSDDLGIDINNIEAIPAQLPPEVLVDQPPMAEPPMDPNMMLSDARAKNVKKHPKFTPKAADPHAVTEDDSKMVSRVLAGLRI